MNICRARTPHDQLFIYRSDYDRFELSAATLRRATPLARLPAGTAPPLLSTTAADDARTAAAAHRTSVTQHLWKLLRESQAPPLRPDGSRLPADSRVVVAYDLTQDKELRNRYESAFGTLRVGRLLEDMDALAGGVAYLHVDDGDPETAPPYPSDGVDGAFGGARRHARVG